MTDRVHTPSTEEIRNAVSASLNFFMGLENDEAFDLWLAEYTRQKHLDSIALFVNYQSGHYRKHSSDAMDEDINAAINAFGVPREYFYDDEESL